jgi:HK97 family phage prohead protease
VAPVFDRPDRSDAVNTPPDTFRRQVGPGGLEMRALPAASAPITAVDATAEQGPIIRGYGSVSNVWTTIGGEEYGFDERFAPGAWTASLSADWRSMFNHEVCELLGRTKSGTLRLAEDQTGLAYEVDINPDDPNAMSTHAKVARGDVDGSSVWFRVIRDEWVYPDATNGLMRPQRTIHEAAGIETGPVTFPAYEEAESSARSLAPLDTVLRAAGMASANKRARTAAALIAGDESVEDALRSLFAAAPELRSQVCACELPESDPPADAAPERAAEPAAEPETNPKSDALAVARARLELRLKTPA